MAPTLTSAGIHARIHVAQDHAPLIMTGGELFRQQLATAGIEPGQLAVFTERDNS